ncbi:MAG: type II toxin-antitoxin system MqsA family antitoxin [Gammaproteobacteria bacterium]|nr:type II toxin-antitoxin system MqsA family antitoxin [Gammaproteobacteria bacterium]
MKCLICNQGETREGIATVTLERGQATLVFKHAPAQVCTNCGEEYLDDTVAGRLLEHAAEALEAGVELDVRQ